MAQFIGNKKIKQIQPVADETTPGGITIEEVEFEDGSREWFSSLMLKQIVTDSRIDETQLRDKRIFPVVEVLLAVLRDWGVKTGETPYLSQLLNASLNANTDAALRELWSKFMPKPKDLDDVTLITVDRVLRSVKDKK